MILLADDLDALLSRSGGPDHGLEPELADNGDAGAANVNILALHAEPGGPLEDGDARLLRGRERREEQEGGQGGAGDAAADYRILRGAILSRRERMRKSRKQPMAAKGK